MGDLRKSREEAPVAAEVVTPETAPPEVTVDPTVADLINDEAPEPVQVEPDLVVFVAFEDFEGRINQDTYEFIKGVPVKMDREQANSWLEAKKGYIK